MKQNDHLSYTILDAEYQVLDAEQPVNRGVRRGILITALILVALGLSALIFPEVIGTGLAFFITVGLFLYGLSQSLLFFQASKDAQRLDLSQRPFVAGVLLDHHVQRIYG